jgi:hypothetical protein
MMRLSLGAQSLVAAEAFDKIAFPQQIVGVA